MIGKIVSFSRLASSTTRLCLCSGPSQPSRPGRGSSRQTADDWRRTSRGDDDEKNDPSENSARTLHHSASWAPRSGPSRQNSASGSIDHRTKSSEKCMFLGLISRSVNELHTSFFYFSLSSLVSTNSYESNQSRDNGYRAASTMSDRNYDMRHSHIQKDGKNRSPDLTTDHE